MPGSGGGGGGGGGGGRRMRSSGIRSRTGPSRPQTPREIAVNKMWSTAVFSFLAIAGALAAQWWFLVPFPFWVPYELNVGEQRPIPVSAAQAVAHVSDSCGGCMRWYASPTRPQPAPTRDNVGPTHEHDELPHAWSRHWRSPTFKLWNDRYQYWFFYLGRGSNITVEVERFVSPIAIGFTQGNFHFPHDKVTPKDVPSLRMREDHVARFEQTSADWDAVVVMVAAGENRWKRSGSVRMRIDYQWAVFPEAPVPTTSALGKWWGSTLLGLDRGVARPDGSGRTWFLTAAAPKWHPSLASGAVEGGDTFTVFVYHPTDRLWRNIGIGAIEVFVVLELARMIVRRFRSERAKIDELFVE